MYLILFVNFLYILCKDGGNFVLGCIENVNLCVWFGLWYGFCFNIIILIFLNGVKLNVWYIFFLLGYMIVVEYFFFKKLCIVLKLCFVVMLWKICDYFI